jgi:hypothetical protein
LGLLSEICICKTQASYCFKKKKEKKSFHRWFWGLSAVTQIISLGLCWPWPAELWSSVNIPIWSPSWQEASLSSRPHLWKFTSDTDGIPGHPSPTQPPSSAMNICLLKLQNFTFMGPLLCILSRQSSCLRAELSHFFVFN